MNFLKKWYTYQKERFPVIKYGIYIFAIVFATFFYNVYIGPAVQIFIHKVTFNNAVNPYLFEVNYMKLIPMFCVAFLQFFMVRIIDEFKDYEEDCKYRPYRPVPRGLIKLNELKIVFIICAILQLFITLFNSRFLGIIYLGFLWIFFAIMSKSFFMKKILDKHILIEVFLDELMMPILVIYLSSFVYYANIIFLWPILLISYIISWIVEVARKIRCKEDEEKGVKTYTAVFGIKGAVGILFILQLILFILHTIILGKERILISLTLFSIASIVNILFAIKQNRKFAKLTELVANIYIFIVYFSMILLVL